MVAPVVFFLLWMLILSLIFNRIPSDEKVSGETAKTTFAAHEDAGRRGKRGKLGKTSSSTPLIKIDSLS